MSFYDVITQLTALVCANQDTVCIHECLFVYCLERQELTGEIIEQMTQLGVRWSGLQLF